MAFDQALISFSKGGVYAAPWLAGTSGSQTLAKYYNSQDINSVDVGKTCDTLSLALKSQFCAKDMEPVNASNSMVKGKSIPFRICTNIWFGTLKIYQQQVNNLFKQSEDLFVNSKSYDLPKLSQKRKHSSNHNKTLKKRKITTTETNQFGLSNSNYGQMLDDFEKWTQKLTDKQSEENIVESQELNIKQPQKTFVQRQSHFQIREITIREINATSYGLTELDDDGGFGEASADEISNFMAFLNKQERNNSSNTTAPSKRKSQYEDEIPHKLRCSSLVTPINKDQINDKPMENGLVPTPIPWTSQVGSPGCNPGTTLQQKSDPKSNVSSDSQIIDKIKEEPYKEGYEINPFFTPSPVSNMAPKKTSKLIVDVLIKIDPEEMQKQISAPINLRQGSTLEALRKLKYKKRKPARELLKRLNKRTILFCPKPKQKCVPLENQEQFERNYIQLVHDIFQSDYKDELATTIFPKWKNSNQKHITRNELKSTNLVPEDNMIGKSPTIENFLGENFHVVNNDENNNAKNDVIKNVISKSKASLMQDDCNEFKENFCIAKPINEWQPYGVMKKLLDIWSCSTDTKINAIEFCNSAKVIISKALAFSSLLSLRKDEFIEITKIPETIYMDRIFLGIRTKYLLKTEY